MTTKEEVYTVETNTLGMEHISPLASDPSLEHHRLTLIILGGGVGRLEREIKF